MERPDAVFKLYATVAYDKEANDLVDDSINYYCDSLTVAELKEAFELVTEHFQKVVLKESNRRGTNFNFDPEKDINLDENFVWSIHLTMENPNYSQEMANYNKWLKEIEEAKKEELRRDREITKARSDFRKESHNQRLLGRIAAISGDSEKSTKEKMEEIDKLLSGLEKK